MQDKKNNLEITEKKYWDSVYANGKSHSKLLPLNNYNKFCDQVIMNKIVEFYCGGDVIEIGAGNSDWIIRVVKEIKPDCSVGLDYSENGCRLLEKKAKENNVNIDVVNSDMFSPSNDLIKKFNFIMSFGVVEHFKDLADVLQEISQFSTPGGIMFSLIPNMAGINGYLTKLWNKEIYDIHIPHDLPSFVKGHHDAGLDILWADYLGSSNFGVLSSCFQNNKGIQFFIYKQLTRISKILWLFESKVKPLPTTKIFSPYILVISKVRK